jgi:hypothetical protein
LATGVLVLLRLRGAGIAEPLLDERGSMIPFSIMTA